MSFSVEIRFAENTALRKTDWDGSIGRCIPLPESNGIECDTNVDFLSIHGALVGLEQQTQPKFTFRHYIRGKTPRNLSFVYDITTVVSSGGLERLATALLVGLKDLLAENGSTTRYLDIACYDFGGIILKKALCIAARDLQFGDIMSSINALVFVNCPHRINEYARLEQMFYRLFRAHYVFANSDDVLTRTDIHSIAHSMAKVTIPTNFEFGKLHHLTNVHLCSTVPNYDCSSQTLRTSGDNSVDSQELYHSIPEDTTHNRDVLHVFCSENVYFRAPFEHRVCIEDVRDHRCELSYYEDKVPSYGRDILFRSQERHYRLRDLLSNSPRFLSPRGFPLQLAPLTCHSEKLEDHVRRHPVLEEFRKLPRFSILEIIDKEDGIASSVAANTVFRKLEENGGAALRFEFDMADDHFNAIEPMLRTVILHMEKASGSSEFSDRVFRALGPGPVHTDGELFDGFLNACEANKTVVTLVLVNFHLCQQLSRERFVKRLVTVLQKTGIGGFKLVVSYSMVGTAGPYGPWIQPFGSKTWPTSTKSGEKRHLSEDPSLYLLYRIEVQSGMFQRTRALIEVPDNEHYAFRDGELFPKCAELWELWEWCDGIHHLPRIAAALSAWTEHNLDKAESVAEKLLQMEEVSAQSLIQTLLEAIPDTWKRQWARAIICWTTRSPRRVTLGLAGGLLSHLVLASEGIVGGPVDTSHESVDALLKSLFGKTIHVVDGEIRQWEEFSEVVTKHPGDGAKPWYHFDSAEAGHDEMARFCLQCLCRPPNHLRILEHDGSVPCGKAVDSGAVQLLRYAIAYWPHHYKSASQGEGAISQDTDNLVLTVLRDDTALYLKWTASYEAQIAWPRKRQTEYNPSPLIRAAQFGLTRVIKRIGTHASDGEWLEAATTAAIHGHLELLLTIFEHLPTPLSVAASNALASAAATSKDEAIIMACLNRLNNTESGQESQSRLAPVLSISCKLGYEGVVERLVVGQTAGGSKSFLNMLKHNNGEPLRHAIMKDHVDIVKMLHLAGLKLDAAGNDEGQWPLEIATEWGSWRSAEYILMCEPEEIAGGFSGPFGALVLLAAEKGHHRVLELLFRQHREKYPLEGLDREASASIASRLPRLFCQEALKSGGGHTDVKCVTLYLGECRDVRTRDQLVGLVGDALVRGDMEMTQLLLAEDNQDLSPLWEKELPMKHAVLTGGLEVVRLLIEKGCPIKGNNSNNASIFLSWAASAGRMKIVRYLLHLGVDVNQPTDQVQVDPPLYAATRYGHVRVMKLLLKAGADPDVMVFRQDPEDRCFQWRPIHVAWNKPKATRLLVRFGADRNALCFQGTPLLMALRCKETALEVVKELLGNKRGDCDLEKVTEKDGRTALVRAITEYPNQEIAMRLLDAGANHQIVPSDHGSILHLAVAFGTSELVSRLLLYGADVNRVNDDGASPLNYLCSDWGHKMVSVACVLLAAGADLETTDSRGFTPVWNAFYHEVDDVFRYLVRRGDARLDHQVRYQLPQFRWPSVWTVFTWACANRADVDKFYFVLDQADDINTEVEDEIATPLQAAVARHGMLGDEESEVSTIYLVKRLLKLGARLDAPVKFWGSAACALHTACLYASFKVFDFLLRRCHARLDIEDKFGQRSPFHLVCYRDVRFIDAVLLRHGEVLSSRDDDDDDDDGVDGGQVTHQVALSPSISDFCPSLSSESSVAGLLLDDDEEKEEEDEAAAAWTKEAKEVPEVPEATPTAALAYTNPDSPLWTRDATGRVPLHYAAACGRPDVVQRILDCWGLCREDAGGKDTEENTDTDTDKNINPVNVQDNDGWTALHWAARFVPVTDSEMGNWTAELVEDSVPERVATIKLLREFGADATSDTARASLGHQNWTPLEVALFHSADKEIRDALLSYRKPGTEFAEVKPGVTVGHHYCDGCFTRIAGERYDCLHCERYRLCFKCHFSRDVLHPPSHGNFEVVHTGTTIRCESDREGKDSNADAIDDGHTEKSVTSAGQNTN